MTQEMFDITAMRMFMTHTGYVALACDDLSGEGEMRLFGDHGVAPPRRVSELVAEMLHDLAAAPDVGDAAGLRCAAEDLKSSLAQVETAIAQRAEGGRSSP